VLFAARSATALHRLLDVLPVFGGDAGVRRRFTLVPGSEFDVEALAAIEHAGARTVPWDEAKGRSWDLIVAASPKGDVRELTGPLALIPHGAGFSKSVRGEGSADSASGLDPAYLLDGRQAVAALHGLAHPAQIQRLATRSQRAAGRATVVGDPTLERILASLSLRKDYRAALGTGARKLIALTSTWGPESLLRRRPALPAELAAALPHDAYQLALIVHPNERSLLSEFDLHQQLAPALSAGLVLPRSYEEWAAVLIAAQAVITDHGSTALYAAAVGCPLIGAYGGGEELIPGSPMDRLLARSPALPPGPAPGPDWISAAVERQHPDDVRALAEGVFAEQGHALDRLREEMYGLLRLPPPEHPVHAPTLPLPAPPARGPAAFAVRVRVEARGMAVERFPAHAEVTAPYLAAEHGAAGERQAQGAGVIYRRQVPAAGHAHPHHESWTAAAWTADTLERYPACRTAAALLEGGRCVVRTRGGALLSAVVEERAEDGRVVRTDAAAVVCGLHAWLREQRTRPDVAEPSAVLDCTVGGRAFRVRLSACTDADAAALL
jgi:hypothetical protein